MFTNENQEIYAPCSIHTIVRTKTSPLPLWKASYNGSLEVLGSLDMLNPGQTIAISQRHTAQPCWPSVCKPRPNDRNIWTQQTATLLGATCCTRLATLLQRDAACCELKIEPVRMPRCNIVRRTWPVDYNIMQHPQMLQKSLTIFKFEPTTPNMSQHITTGWPNARNILHPTMLRYVALKCCDTVSPGLYEQYMIKR